jgi:hypothetical protein
LVIVQKVSKTNKNAIEKGRQTDRPTNRHFVIYYQSRFFSDYTAIWKASLQINIHHFHFIFLSSEDSKIILTLKKVY